MKVCIDGIMQEVEDTLEMPDSERPRTLEDEVQEIKAGVVKLKALIDPLVKLMSQSKEN